MPHRRPPRLKGFDYLGPHRYFVTCCALGRHAAFVKDDPALACPGEGRAFHPPTATLKKLRWS